MLCPDCKARFRPKAAAGGKCPACGAHVGADALEPRDIGRALLSTAGPILRPVAHGIVLVLALGVAYQMALVLMGQDEDRYLGEPGAFVAAIMVLVPALALAVFSALGLRRAFARRGPG